MLLELTLVEDDDDFGLAGSKFMIGYGYVVGVGIDPSTGKTKIHVDMSDQDIFKTILVEEPYERFYIMRLNP